MTITREQILSAAEDAGGIKERDWQFTEGILMEFARIIAKMAAEEMMERAAAKAERMANGKSIAAAIRALEIRE